MHIITGNNSLIRKQRHLFFLFKNTFASCSILLTVLLHLDVTYAQNQLNARHYTTDEGLPHNVGFDLLQDSKGYMWIGTDDGLARFDGRDFKVYRSNDGLLSNYSTTLAEAKDGTLWIGSWKGGVNYMKNGLIHTPKIDVPLFKVAYLGIKENKLLLSDLRYNIRQYTKINNQWRIDNSRRKRQLYIKKDLSLAHDEMLSSARMQEKVYLKRLHHVGSYLATDKSSLFFGSFSGVWKYSNDSTFTPFYPEIIKQDTIYHVFQDTTQRYWLGARGKILTIDSNGKVTTMSKGLPPEEMYMIKVTSSGEIYFITSVTDFKSRGVYSYNPSTGKLVDLKKKLDLKSLPSFIEIDKEDNVWLTTNGDGVYCIPSSPFKNYDGQNGLSNVFINSIKEDKQGNIYVGTVDGMFVYQKNQFIRKKLFENTLTYQVHEIFANREKELVVSLLVKSKNAEGTYLFKTSDNEPQKLHRKPFRIKQYLDNQNNLWFSEKGGWLSCQPYPLKSTRGKHNYLLGKDLNINQIFEYGEMLWLATNKGLFSFREKQLSESKRILQFPDTLTIANGLPGNHINMVSKDANGALWISTSNGLCKLENNKISCFSQKDGLAGNNCTSLLFDHRGMLWVGTSKGLSYFDGKRFTNYNHKTGLISSDVRCLFLDSKKQLWIGTSKGVSVLDISISPKKTSPPAVYIEAAEVNGLPEVLPSLLELDYDASLKISFRALTYAYPEGVKFQYRLNKGKWLSTKSNFVEYNAFRAGTYSFEIRGKKFNSEWSSVKKLEFRVKQPFWMTWGAMVVYTILFVLIVYGVTKWRSKKLEKEKLKLEQLVVKRTHELERQKEEITAQSEQLKEMDKIKSNFFSNISHEFRTPLTLIMGPARKLLGPINETSLKIYSQSILTNAQRLLKLMNQLLDFSKLESGKMVIQLETAEFNVYLKNILNSFELLARQKNIILSLTEPPEEITCEFDRNKLEKVFFNLLSNAFKFTPENGVISIGLTEISGIIQVSVSDTGIGISEKSLPFIFDRFYQADSSKTRKDEGTGIGLALAKELIELHGGTIEVNSVPDKGTTFIVWLPILVQPTADVPATKLSFSDISTEEFTVAHVSHKEASLLGKDNQKNTVLVVEDNDELRKFICIELASDYNVEEASDGAEGIARALEIIPDVIISDVMMPKIDGFELLNTLRNNPNTSHIPVIILSAKASIESKIKGLETGSDDYLTKPFNSQELLLRVRNILARREKLKAVFMQNIAKPGVVIEPSEVTVNSMEEVFLKKAIEVVEKQMGNPEFNVTLFYKEMGMSQSNLFRKLKAVTNLSPTEFIRTIKLKRAASLIQQKSGTIEEVAFQAGFNDMSYFYRCFKKQFRITPAEYQK